MDEAFARRTDPETSHDAAAGVNVNRGEQRVLSALSLERNWGGLTIEETANFLGRSVPTVGPRFAVLERRRMIRKVRGPLTLKVVTRAGASGAQRAVYRIQPDRGLWLEADPKGKRTAKEMARNAALEEAATLADEKAWSYGHFVAAYIRELMT